MQRSSAAPRPAAVVLGGSHWHAPLYRAGLARRFRVTAVQDPCPSAVQAFADALDAPVVADVGGALERDDVDVAFVFSPHHEMVEVGRELLERGIPFVIEKPAGTSLPELRALEQEARLLGVPVTIPLVQRGAPIDRWLQQVGVVAYERMAFIAGPPDRYERSGNPWMLQPALSGGGSLMNLGPHFVDLAARHIGEPVEVVRRLAHTLHGGLVDDHATMILTTATGREAIVEVGYAFPDSPLKRYCSFTAAGTDGFATVDTTGNATFTGTDGSTRSTTLDVDSDPLYDVFVEAVADTLPSGFSGMPTLTELVATMEAIWSPDTVGAARG